jgi:hypothetical protein
MRLSVDPAKVVVRLPKRVETMDTKAGLSESDCMAPPCSVKT